VRVFSGVAELRAAQGTHVGTGPWTTVSQEQVDRFADATHDHQWIHVDPQRARRGPFGAPIAHGLLTLSLLPELVGGVYAVAGTRMGVNYGFNRVRFTAPVPVGSRVRARVELLEVVDVPGGVQLTTAVTVELESSARPALVAEWVVRRHL
jgi:acyl dehydratase